MRKIFVPIFCLLLAGAVYIYQDELINLVLKQHIYTKEVSDYKANQYVKDNSFDFVQETEDFVPDNKQELYNIIYTILNAGLDNFIFYCGEEYDSCIDDVKDLTSANDVLASINNFVHPYNSYSKLYISVNSMGEVEINVQKLYSFAEIQEIDEQVNKIMDEILTDKMTTTEKVKTIHDYIANNAVYDTERSKEIKNNVANDYGSISHKANGILQNGMAICGGYTDLMAIFLNKLNIPNYKISNDEHVWNFVYINHEWLHLDITWDDPVTPNGENLVLHEFFLINTQKLEEIEKEQHNFSKEIYSEAK